jgi:hypothetical protein
MHRDNSYTLQTPSDKGQLLLASALVTRALSPVHGCDKPEVVIKLKKESNGVIVQIQSKAKI